MGEDTKVAAAGERWKAAPALQSKRAEEEPPAVVLTLLAFSSLKCSTGERSILTFRSEIYQSGSELET